jgi:hypothetical protein
MWVETKPFITPFNAIVMTQENQIDKQETLPYSSSHKEFCNVQK